MKLIIPGRLPCMNDLIAANRLNKYAGAGVKKKTQKEIILILRPQVQGQRFTEKVNIRIEIVNQNGYAVISKRFLKKFGAAESILTL